MYVKSFKPYKKTYRVGEKVYRLVIDEVCDRLVVRIAENTIKSLSKTSFVSRIYHIELAAHNDAYNFEYVERIAPRTPKGKEFLRAIAKRIVKKKIRLLTTETNEYRKLLATFS